MTPDEHSADAPQEEPPQRLLNELRKLADHNAVGNVEPGVEATEGRSLRPRIRRTHNKYGNGEGYESSTRDRRVLFSDGYGPTIRHIERKHQKTVLVSRASEEYNKLEASLATAASHRSVQRASRKAGSFTRALTVPFVKQPQNSGMFSKGIFFLPAALIPSVASAFVVSSAAAAARTEMNTSVILRRATDPDSGESDISRAGGGDTDGESAVSKGSKKKAGTYNPLKLAVLKLGFTELRFTSLLNYEKREGEYSCVGCGELLFDSRGKYDSGSGWPSFFRTADGNGVNMIREWDGRVECRCRGCKGHLGHVFPDGPSKTDVGDALEGLPETDLKVRGDTFLPRYCINGAALKFTAADKS